MPTLEVHEWEAGDWVELWLDGQLHFDGHSVPDFVWLEMLRRAGVRVLSCRVQTDEYGTETGRTPLLEGGDIRYAGSL